MLSLNDLRQPFKIITPARKFLGEENDIAIEDANGIVFMEIWSECPKSNGGGAIINAREVAEHVCNLLNSHP